MSDEMAAAREQELERIGVAGPEPRKSPIDVGGGPATPIVLNLPQGAKVFPGMLIADQVAMTVLPHLMANEKFRSGNEPSDMMSHYLKCIDRAYTLADRAIKVRPKP